MPARRSHPNPVWEPRIPSRWTAVVIALLAVGCAGFDATPVREPGPVERVTSMLIDEAFSRPSHLRPCCAFGHSLRVEVAELPVPIFEVQNVVAPDGAGRHTYDGGLISMRNPAQRGFVSPENNGLLYTCRGGFLDIAHVRDYADWTAFLALRLDAMLESGALADLGDEAASRIVYVEAFSEREIASLGRRRIALELARWLAYQVSVWHEVATWYGYAALDLFPERASAFSPEDLYSNLTGIELAAEVLSDDTVTSEEAFNRAMDRALETRLEQLGALPPELTVAAASAVDGRWWNSRARVPDMALVLRRNFDLGPRVSPWQIPDGVRPAALEAACRETGREAWVLEPTDRIGDVAFDTRARLDLRVDTQNLDSDFPLPGDSPWITQRDLPLIVTHARAANRERFGDDADHP
jgi:hypothetical protein